MVGMDKKEACVGDETQSMRCVLTLKCLPDARLDLRVPIVSKMSFAGVVHAAVSSTSWLSTWRWHALQVAPSLTKSATLMIIEPFCLRVC